MRPGNCSVYISLVVLYLGEYISYTRAVLQQRFNRSSLNISISLLSPNLFSTNCSFILWRHQMPSFLHRLGEDATCCWDYVMAAVTQLAAVLFSPVICLMIEPDILWFLFKFLGYNGWQGEDKLEWVFSKITSVNILKNDYIFRFFSEGVPFISIYM